MRFTPESPLIVWRLIDGKPGHEKQTLGLIQALGRQVTVEIHDIRVESGLTDLMDWLLGRFPAGAGLPAPHILIGAGHRTHFALLAARRARGGRAVVLMQPSLPARLFDLCLIPEHDQPAARPNVVATRGALNAVSPGRQHRPDLGLILIGGPSEHYAWDSQQVLEQIARLTRETPNVGWRLTTSRRTPADFLDRLTPTRPSNLEILPCEDTPPGWLETELAQTGQAWVTEDSVSMVYEALTAGCAVGLLRLPQGQDGRVARGVARLIREGWVVPFETWHADQPMLSAPEGFDEADRCARLILADWFQSPTRPAEHRQ